ncbi:MAG: alcohol dehydrogenase catalytic domain-containing protein, partial [Solirubrobacteraceae bacterium]
MRAVRFERYGGIDVLDVVDVQPPAAGRGELLVRVKDAGINPGEAKIREGLLHERWPATFPSGQGSDLAGIVEQVGDGVDGWAAGDEVIGFTHNRASQAELVVVEAENVTTRPAGVPWPVAGSLFVAGTTAYATVRAVSAASGDTVVVAGAAGGVGSIAVQLAVLAGATVIGLAGEHNHAWLWD